MQRIFRLFILTTLALASAFAADIDGTWSATLTTQAGPVVTTWTLKAEGNKLTGKASSSFGDREITEGKIDGNKVAWVEVINSQGVTVKVVCTGVLNGDELKLNRSLGALGATDSVAKRQK